MLDMAANGGGRKAAPPTVDTPLFSAVDNAELRRGKSWLDSRIRTTRTLSSEVVTITPALAEYILINHNNRNRAPKPRKIEQYRADMAAGKWQITHQGISFATDGSLNDGQNRLTAVVASGMPVKFLVSFGETPEAYHVIDTMKPRGGDDVFHVAGFANAALTASSARLLHAVTLGTVSTNSTLTNQDLLHFVLEREPVFSETVTQGSTAVTRLKCPPTPMVVAIFLIRSGKNYKREPKLLEAFLADLTTGAGLKQNSPILLLRDSIQLGNAGLGFKSAHMRSVALCAQVIIAWNKRLKSRNGRPRWSAKDAFPQAE